MRPSVLELARTLQAVTNTLPVIAHEWIYCYDHEIVEIIGFKHNRAVLRHTNGLVRVVILDDLELRDA